MTIKRNLSAKVQGSRMVLDSPIYFYQGDRDICLVITITGNKYIYDKDTKLSFVIVKPNGEVVENAMSALINGKYNVLLTRELFDGEDEVGQFLCQLRQHNGSAIVSLPPFAIHVLKGYSISLDVTDGLLTEQEFMLLTENMNALSVGGLIKISDLPQTENMVGYAPVTQGDTTYKLDVSKIATKDDLQNVTIDTSNLATKQELSNGLATKADKSEIPSLDGYATETYVQAKIAEASLGGEVDLSGYATKDELNSSLATKADRTELHSHDNKTVLDGITEDKVNVWDNKSDFDGDYNSLTNKPTIPSVEGYATETYVNEQVATKANRSEIPTLTSELTNDSGFITTIPNEYVTETELDAKGYLTEHQDISGLATRQELTDGLATKSDTNHTHTGMLTSTTITRIELVDTLPEQQEENVLYIVRGE